MFGIGSVTLERMIDYLTYAVKHSTAIEDTLKRDPRQYSLLQDHCKPLIYDIEKVRDMLCDIRCQEEEKNHEDNN